MNTQNKQRSALLGAITFALVCGCPFLVSGADTPLSSGTPQEESATPADPGEVQERGLSRMMPGRMAPGGKILAPGGTFSALTKAECTGLGCKAVTDNTCPDVGALKERCVCKGGGKGLCIDAVK